MASPAVSTLTVRDLRLNLVERGLSPAGKKADLLARLIQSEVGPHAESSETPAEAARQTV